MRIIKVIHLAVILLAVVGTAAANGLEQPEAERETVFLDLAWGDPVERLGPAYKLYNPITEALRNIVGGGDSAQTKPEPGVEVWRKKDEVRSLGILPVASVEYRFFESRLFRITVTLPERGWKENYDMLNRILEARYGKPTKKPFLSNNRGWLFPDITVWIYSPLIGDLRFELTSPQILQEYEVWLEAYKQEKARESAGVW